MTSERDRPNVYSSVNPLFPPKWIGLDLCEEKQTVCGDGGGGSVCEVLGGRSVEVPAYMRGVSARIVRNNEIGTYQGTM